MRYLGNMVRLLLFVLIMEMLSPIIPALPGIGVAQAFADQWVCGQDLNNDGNVSDPGETANCISTQQGQLCPISATDCTQTPAPITLTGSVTIPVGNTFIVSGSGNRLIFSWQGGSGTITANGGVTFSGTTGPIYLGYSFYDYRDYNFSGSGNLLNFSDTYFDWWTWYEGGTITVNGGGTLSGGATSWYIGRNTTHVTFSGSGDQLVMTEGFFNCYWGYGCFSSSTQLGTITFSGGNEITYSCPLGNQYACMDNGGTMQCSPNQCVDLTTNPATVTNTNSNMLQNNGQTDSQGNCLGQIYIFSGRGERCEQAGVKDGFHDCCSNKGSMALADSVGGVSALGTAASAVTDIYHLAQVAYYTNAILTTGGASITSSLSSASLAVQQAVTDGVAAGSVDAGMEAYAAALLNPTTIALAAAIYLVNYFLLQSCDQQDMEVSMLNASGYCHYVGEYCEESWPLIGCVQEAKGYCCFNSKLARIIQEQGRPQLKDFQPDGAWGTGQSPNCRGFTPQEFQMIDFSKIDLSSYYGDIEKNLSTTLQNANANMQQKINNFYQNTQK